MVSTPLPIAKVITVKENPDAANIRLTWFVAKKLGWSDIPGYKETISGAHHSYPCIGSMDKDPQIGDTILHKAGYIIRESVEDGMESEKREKTRQSAAEGIKSQTLASEN